MEKTKFIFLLLHAFIKLESSDYLSVSLSRIRQTLNVIKFLDWLRYIQTPITWKTLLLICILKEWTLLKFPTKSGKSKTHLPSVVFRVVYNIWRPQWNKRHAKHTSQWTEILQIYSFVFLRKWHYQRFLQQKIKKV